MRRCVLVTGPSGFIGRQVLEPLLNRGFEVHAVARHAGGTRGVSWHEADLLEPGEAESVVASVLPTHLLHLAWFAVHGEFWTSDENVRWVESTVRLFRAFAVDGGRRAVFAGTCAEYDWNYGWCSEAVTPLRPHSLYGVAKNATRELVQATVQDAGVSIAWARIFFLYGPYEHPQRLVASVARALAASAPAPVSHVAQVRDFMHVTDVADAFAALVDSDVVGAVNLGSGEPRTIGSVAQTLGSLSGRPDLVRFGERQARRDEPPFVVADVRRLREEVRWAPRRTLETGLADTLAWWREHPQESAAPAERRAL